MRRTTYIDHSTDFLRGLVVEIGPTVEAMADLAVESIKAQIPKTDEPSDPGDPPSSHPSEYELYESWKRGRVKRVRDRIFANVFSTALREDGRTSLALVLEHGSDEVAPRPHIGPGMEAVRSKLLSLARAAMRR